ncbi:FAD-dependent oxidoreductase [Streptomyces sp. SID12501]|uniref:FAD dependent oxidoreductase domain-containing protein n=1 Tax=Streptomyces sp. SID12501 TaxID=2706042 RepID=A0A6B3C847_9ACTN|nr:hypothetical protein [Streptomyces sp. SID12501]
MVLRADRQGAAEHGHRITAAIACHVARAGGSIDQLTQLLMHPEHESGRHTRHIALRSGQVRALDYIRRVWASASDAISSTRALGSRHETYEVLAALRDRIGADGRIALGGRGVPYRFGSRTDRDGRTQLRTVEALTALLHTLFPAASKVPVAHPWCGVPGDWCATVNFDPGTGLGAAGGYVGSGLTTANLAGRTLTDLVLGEKTERTALPWVGRAVRRWEPEPLRWAGVQALYALYREADRREYRSQSGRTSIFAKAADLVSGR